MALSDKQLLEALHLRDTGQMNTTQLAKRFGTTRNSMIGVLYRINKDTNKSDPDGNQNGTMPEKWWKK